MPITKEAMITLCGRPNVGKSSLTNALVGEKIAIVSNKPQTTRTRIRGVVNTGDTQLVLMDTPGLHKAQNRLGDYMVKVVENSLSDIDVVVMLVEPIAHVGKPEEILIERLKRSGEKAILVINKIDTVKKEDLLEVMAVYGAAHAFTAVVPLCARTGEGVQQLVDELKALCIPSPQLFPDGMVSDQPERQLVAEIIREKMLQKLDKEVPHGVAVEIERWEERDDGLIAINAAIYCERKTHKGIIIGKNGAMLKQIGAVSRYEIERMLDAKVYLELWVKVKEDWRNKPGQIRNFGYEEE